MPPQTQNKFYKYSVNNQTYYDVLPDYGNVPYSYTPISAQEYLAGATPMLQKYSSYTDSNSRDLVANLTKGISLAQSLAPTATGGGQSGVIMNPDTGAPQLASQYAENPSALKDIASGNTVTRNGVVYPASQTNIPPQFNIPATIPSAALNSTATKASILASLPNLQPGQRSPEVQKLQQELIKMGLMQPGLDTGYYGDITKAAVAKLQSQAGVQAPTGQEGYFGPMTKGALTPEVVAKLQADVSSSIASGTPEGKAKADAALTAAGIPAPTLPTSYDSPNLTAFYNQYLSYQSNRQQQLDKVLQDMSNATLAASGAINKAEGNARYDMTTIGRDRQRIKDNLQNVLETYKPAAELLQNELKLNADQMSTALTFAKTIADLNKPEYHTVNGQLYKFSPDGKILATYGTPDNGGSIPGYSGEFGATIDIASGLGTTNQDRNQIRSNLQKFIANGDYKSAYQEILNVSKKGLTAENRTKTENASIDLSLMNTLESKIKAYQAAGGDMNFVKAAALDAGKRVGVLASDKPYAALAGEIDRAFQQYRQNMTGAAFGVQESADYQKVVPSKSGSFDLNLAVLDGARQYANDYINGVIRTSVGEGGINIKDRALTPPQVVLSESDAKSANDALLGSATTPPSSPATGADTGFLSSLWDKLKLW